MDNLERLGILIVGWIIWRGFNQIPPPPQAIPPPQGGEPSFGSRAIRNQQKITGAEEKI